MPVGKYDHRDHGDCQRDDEFYPDEDGAGGHGISGGPGFGHRTGLCGGRPHSGHRRAGCGAQGGDHGFDRFPFPRGVGRCAYRGHHEDHSQRHPVCPGDGLYDQAFGRSAL